MAVAKTNAKEYTGANGNDNGFSVVSSIVFFDGTGSVQEIAEGNGVSIISVCGEQSIHVSIEGEATFQNVNLGFTVGGLIYSKFEGKFIAVGWSEEMCMAAESLDGLTWEKWNNAVCSESSKGPYGKFISIREIDGKYVVCAYWKRGFSSNRLYIINIVKENGEYVPNEVCEEIQDGKYEKHFTGNNRTILKTNGNIFVFSGASIASADIFPVSVCNGYFIALNGNTLMRSVNAIDYSNIGTCAVEPKAAVFRDGYYYIIGASSICRGTSLSQATKKQMDDYIEYDEGASVEFNSVGIFNKKIALFGGGFIMQLDVSSGSNPLVMAIETLSAKEALRLAKEYIDEKLELLETRVANLENESFEQQQD